MNPGTLDRRIEIQRQQAGTILTAADGSPLRTASGEALVGAARQRFREPVFSWVALYAAWARMLTRTGGESTDNSREVGRGTVAFRMRYRSDVTIADRIIYNGQAYDITNITEIGRRAMMDVDCTIHTNTRPA
jgi:SPP1 family predicted phage head-tail adaptor